MDYYYEVVKPAANDPNVSEEERSRLTEKYFKMKNDKEAEIIARKLGIEDGKVKTLKDLKKNKIFKEGKKEGENIEKQMKKEWERKVNPSSSISSSSYRKPVLSSSDAGAAILIGCFVVGVILLIVTVFTLNFYVLALGGILFLIGVAGLSWGSRGTHDNTSGLFWYTYGSHNAKKNMYRGHRYSKRK
jgi:hypothetical protein